MNYLSSDTKMKSQFSLFLLSATLILGANGVILKCNFQYSNPTYIASCSDFVDNGNHQLEALEGTHAENMTDADVNYLQIAIMSPTGQNLTFVPTGIAKLTPNLSFFMIQARAQEISAESLDGLTQLENFYITTPIKHLPGNLFRGTPNLRMLQIMSTNYMEEGLESVGANLLGNLSKLMHVSIYGQCVRESTMSRLQLMNLNQFLPVLCPSGESIDFCPTGCIIHMETIQRENDDLRSRVEELERLMRPECKCRRF